MNQRYVRAIQLSFLIVVLFTIITGVIFFAYTGEIKLLYEARYYILFAQLLSFLITFLIIQLRIENLSLLK